MMVDKKAACIGAGLALGVWLIREVCWTARLSQLANDPDVNQAINAWLHGQSDDQARL